jgi:hemerythrin
VSHFKTEERLATSASIDFSGHEDAHEKMLETVSQTLGQMASNNSDLYSLIRYISYWFEIHILRYDLILAKCLSAAAH